MHASPAKPLLRLTGTLLCDASRVWGQRPSPESEERGRSRCPWPQVDAQVRLRAAWKHQNSVGRARKEQRDACPQRRARDTRHATRPDSAPSLPPGKRGPQRAEHGDRSRTSADRRVDGRAQGSRPTGAGLAGLRQPPDKIWELFSVMFENRGRAGAAQRQTPVRAVFESTEFGDPHLKSSRQQASGETGRLKGAAGEAPERSG